MSKLLPIYVEPFYLAGRISSFLLDQDSLPESGQFMGCRFREAPHSATLTPFPK